MIHVRVFTFNPIEENTYVLFNNENECAIVDPGCYFSQEKDALKLLIKSKNLIPKLLLNTHCHLDHVFGNKFIADEYGLSLHLHKKEEAMLQMAPASGLMFNLPFDNYQGQFIFLDEPDKIQLGNDELEIVNTPGHSPGSICFYCRKQHFIIAGDTLFKDSIGRTDLPGGDYQTLINSIKRKLFGLPDDVIVYSGHGPETSIGDEKKFNPFVGEHSS